MLILIPGRQIHGTAGYSGTAEQIPDSSAADKMREEIMRQTKQYYGSTPKVVKGEDIKGHDKKFDWAIVQNKPKDWEFMKQSGEILRNLPETWTAYSDDEGGRMGIIQMEFNELMNAKGTDAREHELVHLASACLHLWRYYEHID